MPVIPFRNAAPASSRFWYIEKPTVRQEVHTTIVKEHHMTPEEMGAKARELMFKGFH